MSETNTENSKTELTDEQIKDRKKELAKYYEEGIPLLELQAKYEELKTRVDVARFTGMKARIMFAEITNPKEPETQKT